MPTEEFKNFVCWREEAVGRIMRTEAEGQTADHVFKGVHHPMRMHRQDLTEASARVAYDEETFLKDFLRDDVDFRFVPVLGQSGTGKSHLVRWLKANTPETEDRRVILIPKTGTNLRDVIRRIIEGMEGDPFDGYRDQLQDARPTMSDQEGQVRLLNELAIAVEQYSDVAHGPDGQTYDGMQLQAREHAQRGLPDLLNDPYFRDYWLEEGGVIERLYNLALGTPDAAEQERRGFSKEDLPLGAPAVRDKASEKAFEFYRHLNSHASIQSATTDLLNECLDTALQQILGFSRNDLERLLLDVRRALAEQGKELVLLIEDFSKQQGIERPLLEALLVDPNQSDQQLCAMRTTLACTNGYYEGFADTARTRASFRVDLNADPDAEETAVDLPTFSARYLNAVRLGEEGLADWYKDAGGQETVPSACGTCPHRDPCHAAFGARNGWGLYPFNETALVRMYERTNPTGFNPRQLINGVLRPVLGRRAEDLRNGKFPPRALHERLGGSQGISAMTQRDLREQDRANYQRRLALVDLWSMHQEARDVDLAVHRAFDLPPLGKPAPADHGETGSPPEEPTPSDTETATTSTKTSQDRALDVLNERLDKIDRWTNGEELDQALTQQLRKVVFQAVDRRINWNTERLLKSHFSAPAQRKPFRQTSINFQNQGPTPRGAEVELEIPFAAGSVEDAAIALQGLLQFSHYGHWKFEKGTRYHRVCARHLDRWADEVVRQLRRPTESDVWNPVPAAAELLAIAARLAGYPMDGTVPLSDRMSALFADLGAIEMEGRSETWTRLFEKFQEKQSDLIEILEAHALCAKGSSRQTKFFDAAQFADALDIPEAWDGHVREPVPDDVKRRYQVIQHLRTVWSQHCEQAMQDERERYDEWQERVEEAFGASARIQETADVVEEALALAIGEGHFRGRRQEERHISEIIDRLRKIDVADAQRAAIEVNEWGSDEIPMGRQLAVLGQDHTEAMRAVDDFTDASSFLDDSLRYLEAEIEEVGSSEGALEDIYTAIEQHMSNLLQDLRKLEERGLPER